MRKKIVAGNWKMNLNYHEAIELFKSIKGGLERNLNLQSILLFPAYPFLDKLLEMNDLDYLHIGAQNVSSEQRGAFTGEVSAEMLSSMNVQYSLIGHSERRHFFKENHELLKNKVNQALSHNINPVFCCGESQEDRQTSNHEEIIERQLMESLFHTEVNDFRKCIIAYEPVWAIGTGQTASPEQAEEMHVFIRQLIAKKYGTSVSENTLILYGGSCNAANSEELFSLPNVDGGLIGGASLKAGEFLTILSNAGK
ncbi:MAG: triose-phosphate isomerase [Vicingaceae bacterium]